MNLNKSMIRLQQSYGTKEEAIRQAGELLVAGGCVTEEYVSSMLERNTMLSTYMGNFVAIPHGTDDSKPFVLKSGISILQVPEGLNFGEGEEEQLVMMIFGIAGKGDEHLEILQKIALYCSEIENVAKLVAAQSAEEIVTLLKGDE